MFINKIHLLSVLNMNCCKSVLLFLIFSRYKINCEIITQLIEDLTKQYTIAPNLYLCSCNKSGKFALERCNKIHYCFLESILFLRYFAKRLIPVKIIHPETEGFSYPTPPNRVFFIVNLHCPEAHYILQDASNAMLFTTPFKWIAYSNEALNGVDIADQYFGQLHVLADSDVTLAVLVGQSETYSIKKIYKICRNSSLIYEDFGEWDGKLFHENIFKENSYRRRKNLKKTILNTCIVITHNDSLNHLTDKR